MIFDGLLKRFVVLSLIMLFTLQAKSQISFVKSNIVDTVSDNSVAYDETLIAFNTGIYKSSDYMYEKVYDSIHPQWLVTACFNGECRNDLAEQGQFLSEYGFSDTLCFIAFHMESHDVDGKSIVKYRIYNSKDVADQAVVEVHFTFKGVTAIKKSAIEAGFNTYPNPVKNALNINMVKPGNYAAEIIDLQGKILHAFTFTNTSKAVINTNGLKSGIYLVKIQDEKNIFTQKIIVE